MRRKKAIIELLGLTLVTSILLGLTMYSGNVPVLGLDLQGGVAVVLKPRGQVDDDRIAQTIAIMNQRINSLGVSEPDIHREGDTIVVQIAGLKDRDKAIDLVGRTAELRFRPVLATLPPEIPGEANAGTSVPGTTPGSAPPGSAVPAEGTPGAASTTPGAVASTTAPPAAAPSTEPPTAPPTVAPAGNLGAAGLGAGEHAGAAAGWQPTPSTITEQAPSTPAPSTPVASAPATPTASDSVPTASTPPASIDPTQLDPTQLQQLQGQQPTTPADVDNSKESLTQTVVLPEYDPKTNTQIARYQLGPAGLTGAALNGASAGLDPQTGQWLVRPTFKPGAEGIDQFNAIASKCFAKDPQICPSGRLAITLDGRVISAPNIQAPDFSADAIQISGSFDESSSKSLATSLKYGALPVFLDQQSTQDVSATLGADSLRAGLIAGLVGFLLVSLYMVVFYRILGLLAIVKLLFEGAFLYVVVTWLGSSAGLALTLAGVTGIIVSIGVSLDSNIVYYEHLREDIRNGRTVRSAIDKSFDSAIGTIWKADGASLLGAGLLYWLAVGPVRGFAFFLALSTVLEVIGSYIYMRPVVYLATGTKLARKHPAWFGLPPDATAGVAESRVPRRPSAGRKPKVTSKKPDKPRRRGRSDGTDPDATSPAGSGDDEGDDDGASTDDEGSETGATTGAT